MVTVLFPPGVLGAVLQPALSASAFHLVQPYWVHTISKFIIYQSYATLIAKTPTNDCGIHIIPAIVTHRTPHAIMKHFHSTLVLTVAIHESDRSCQKSKACQYGDTTCIKWQPSCEVSQERSSFTKWRMIWPCTRVTSNAQIFSVT